METDALKGIEDLRACVEWLNYRNEIHNVNKTAKRLLNEYLSFKSNFDKL